MLRQHRHFILSVAIVLLAACGPPAGDYDLVILNGRVMDPETNFDDIRNVGVNDRAIVTITTREISGAKTIDASGLVVAPGFINAHNHAFSPFEQQMLAHDGATTLMDTELGAASPRMYYERYEGNSFLNYGAGVSHEDIRRVVMSDVPIEQTFDPTDFMVARGIAQDGHAEWAVDIPTPEQHKEILTMVEQGMCDGALSVSSTVGYMGFGVTTHEMFDLQKIAKKWNRFFGSHTRFGPTENLPMNYTLGAREVIANAVALDGALILSHIQNQNWWEIYEMTRRLQAQGMAIFADYYPSISGNPSIAAPPLMPENLEANNLDPTRNIRNPHTGEYFESYEAFYKMQRETPDIAVVIEVRDPAWREQWAHMKDIAIASDAVAYRDSDGNLLPMDADQSEYGGHKRNAGTYGTVFRWAREQGIPLMQMVNNASYIPAKYFSMVGLEAMQRRGRMQEGMVADITIFDPETISDAATHRIGERGVYTRGIPHVIVNGQVIIEDGVADHSARAGQPIRYPVVESCDLTLEYDEKQFQWHADLPNYVDPYR